MSCRPRCPRRGRGLYSGQSHLLPREAAVRYQVPIALHYIRLALVSYSVTTHSMFSWLSSMQVASRDCGSGDRLGAEMMRWLIPPPSLPENHQTWVLPRRGTFELQPWSQNYGVWAFANRLSVLGPRANRCRCLEPVHFSLRSISLQH